MIVSKGCTSGISVVESSYPICQHFYHCLPHSPKMCRSCRPELGCVTLLISHGGRTRGCFEIEICSKIRSVWRGCAGQQVRKLKMPIKDFLNLEACAECESHRRARDLKHNTHASILACSDHPKSSCTCSFAIPHLLSNDQVVTTSLGTISILCFLCMNLKHYFR